MTGRALPDAPSPWRSVSIADQDDVQVFGQRLATAADRFIRGGARHRYGQRFIGARTIFVDPVAGKVGGAGILVRVRVVAIAAAKILGEAVVIVIAPFAKRGEQNLSERRFALDAE